MFVFVRDSKREEGAKLQTLKLKLWSDCGDPGLYLYHTECLCIKAINQRGV